MSDQTKREIKLVGQLQPGDVVVEPEEGPDGNPMDVYRTVRIAEPIADSPGRYLVVYAGADTDNVRSTEDYAIATRDEIAAHEALLAEAEKRTRMRAGLWKLIEAIEGGMPLPAHFDIQGICMDSPDDVRTAAKLLGAAAVDRDHGNRQTLTEAKAGDAEVQLRLWHLTRPRAVES